MAPREQLLRRVQQAAAESLYPRRDRHAAVGGHTVRPRREMRPKRHFRPKRGIGRVAGNGRQVRRSGHVFRGVAEKGDTEQRRLYGSQRWTKSRLRAPSSRGLRHDTDGAIAAQVTVRTGGMRGRVPIDAMVAANADAVRIGCLLVLARANSGIVQPMSRTTSSKAHSGSFQPGNPYKARPAPNRRTAPDGVARSPSLSFKLDGERLQTSRDNNGVLLSQYDIAPCHDGRGRRSGGGAAQLACDEWRRLGEQRLCRYERMSASVVVTKL